MLRLELHEEAELELAGQAIYLDAQREGVGARFLALFYEKCEMLCRLPKIGHSLTSDLRELTMEDFRFNIVYGVYGDVLYVLAIAHHRRQPGYWADRLPNR